MKSFKITILLILFSSPLWSQITGENEEIHALADTLFTELAQGLPPPPSRDKKTPELRKKQTDTARNLRLGTTLNFGESQEGSLSGNAVFLRVPISRFYVQGYIPLISRNRAGYSYDELSREKVGYINDYRNGKLIRVDDVLYRERGGLQVLPIAQVGLETPVLAGKRLNFFGGVELGVRKYDTRTLLILGRQYVQKGSPDTWAEQVTLEEGPGEVSPNRAVASLAAGAAYTVKKFSGASIDVIGDYNRWFSPLADSSAQVRVGVAVNFSRTR